MPDGPPRMKGASFDAVRELYSAEKFSLLKVGYKLNAKAVNPTSMERQNVKLALDVINPFVSNALETRGAALKLVQAQSTADFINIIVTWWKVVNVKSPFKGHRLKDAMQEPVQSIDGHQLTFLNGIVEWLNTWKSIDLSSGTMTRETHTALRLTCYSLVELSRYCLEELKFKCVLLGKFQTYALEDRFGRYRQLAGAQYHVPVRQIFESEKKLRLQKLLTIPQWKSSVDSDPEESPQQYERSVVITEEDVTGCKSDIDAIAYVAGYCAHAAMKKLACALCCSTLVFEDRDIEVEDLKTISNLTRGGLKFPRPCTVHIVLITKLVVEKLSAGENAKEFLPCSNQRLIVSSTAVSLLKEDIDIETCQNGHKPETVVKLVVNAATNTLLKNYCKLKNDAIQGEAQKKDAARKAKTFKKK